MCRKMHINIFLLTCTYLLSNISADEILGCGGFIKSDVPLDYSRIQVKLFTKQGSLKDLTDCAPNNGYYFLPLYDKGAYILKIEPPTGWSFEETEVNLYVDGKTDLCSLGKDINFIFKGFGITGKVNTYGQDVGPAGITIHLTGNSPERVTITGDEGQFNFTPVVPGTYNIKASHSKWKFKKSSLIIPVKVGNTELPKDSLIIAGYDVVGSVKSESEPIKGVRFILLKPQNSQTALFVEDCDKTSLPGFTSTLGEFICYVRSNENGSFIFPSVSTGRFFIVPYYGQDIKFDIQPAQIELTVSHNSVLLDTSFEIKGFTVKGRVLSSRDGKGVSGATVYVNKKSAAITKPDGWYVLDNIQTGTYKLHATVSDLQYIEQIVKISPNNGRVPDLIPSAYNTCGKVLSEDSHEVIISKKDTGEIISVTTSVGSGTFCTYLAPGIYDLRVIVSDNAKDKGLQFFPTSHQLEIIDSSPKQVSFSQLKATVSGSVECIRKTDCEGLTVVLRLMSSDETFPYTALVTNGKFTYVDIPPGSYEVSIKDTMLCWQSSKHYIVINSAIATIIPFINTGFSVLFELSHQTQVKYGLVQEKDEPILTGVLKLSSGTTTACVEQAGTYKFTAVGCHGYKINSVQCTIPSSTPVQFTAETHLFGVQIVSPVDVDDIIIEVYTAVGVLKDEIGPLIPERSEGKFIYQTQLQLTPREELDLVPKSAVLLFSPRHLVVNGDDDCIELGGEFFAAKGKIIDGVIIPPLEGVLVTVTTSDHNTLYVETESDGYFRFGPLAGHLKYQIIAEKDSYVMTGPDAKGNFHAHKLAEIVVEVVDQADGAPLSGVLLSVSGGSNYRRNLQTDLGGKRVFGSLSPSDYFVRPMMKEYKFEPNSKMVQVQEGQVERIKLSGKRVAFSAYGMVHTLSGAGESGAFIEAHGIGSECIDHIEEATTDSTGNFRLRGLQPKCMYDLKLKSDLVVEEERNNGITIEMADGDLFDIHLISLQKPTYTDITVHVYTPNLEHYRALRVRLGLADYHDTVIQSVRLDNQLIGNKKTTLPRPGVLVLMNSVPLDNKQYIIQLESSLSQATHVYESNPVYFYANSSFKHANLEFHPRTKVSDQDINQSSILVLPLAVIIGLFIYNSDQVMQMLSNALGKLNSTLVQPGKQYSSIPEHSRGIHTDAAEIEQIVQTINSLKQKQKPRKI